MSGSFGHQDPTDLFLLDVMHQLTFGWTSTTNQRNPECSLYPPSFLSVSYTSTDVLKMNVDMAIYGPTEALEQRISVRISWSGTGVCGNLRFPNCWYVSLEVRDEWTVVSKQNSVVCVGLRVDSWQVTVTP